MLRTRVILIFMVYMVSGSLSSAAVMGINPSSPNLFTASAYGSTYQNNKVSAMCVDCHTENPKPNSGTHFVVHDDGAAVRNTNSTAIEKLDSWPTNALSRYGVSVPNSPPSDTVTGAEGEMICESCHNLVLNAPGGNNLLAVYQASLSSSSVLCVGCHAAQSAGPPSHHPMTGQSVGPDDDDAAPHTLMITHGSHVRAEPVSDTSEYAVVYTLDSGMSCASCHNAHSVSLGAAARCLKRGWSGSAEAEIAGKPVNVVYHPDVPETGDTTGSVKVWDTNDNRPGIDRQSDITGKIGASYRLVINQDPLCDACHAF